MVSPILQEMYTTDKKDQNAAILENFAVLHSFKKANYMVRCVKF